MPENKRKITYIAGPFRAKTPWEIEENIRQAERYALQIARTGDIPLCPHTMYRFFQNSLPDTFWLAAGIELLSRCDAIYMCPGWGQSTGSKAELAWAEEHGLEIYYCG